MNHRITRVAVVAVVMLGALIVGTTYWQTWASAGLADRQDNEIQRVAQFTIKRGTIYANDGTTVLAKNRAVKVGGKTLYYRTYPQRGLTAHVVGYSTITRSQAGLERSFNDYLTGANGNLSSVFRSTFDRWRGVTVTGNDVYTTINAKAQKVALDALEGPVRRRGRAQPAHGRDPRDGVEPVLQPEPRREGLRQDRAHQGAVQRRRAAPEPRHAGPLHPGLDVQDHHRGGRARHGRVHAGLELRRTRATAPSTGSRSTTRATPTRTAPRRSAG